MATTGQPGQRTAPIARLTLVLRQQNIIPAHSYKYLGVILDQELHFREHVSYALSRGTAWVLQFQRLSRPTMGMPPRYMRLLYKVIDVARMLYAADVFLTPTTGQAGGTKVRGSMGITKRLARVQRMASMLITGAMHSTATDVLDAHADLLPFPLLVNQICLRSITRLATLPNMHPLYKHVRKMRRYVKRHSAPLHDLLHALGISPDEVETISLFRWALGWERDVEMRKTVGKEAAYREGVGSKAGTKVFTDRSDIDGEVGAAAILSKNG